MVKFLALLAGALLIAELVRLAMKRWAAGPIAQVVAPATPLFLLFSAVRHPRFGWTEAPMGLWDLGVIAGVSLVVVVLSQLGKAWLMHRVFGGPMPEMSEPS